MLEGAVKKRVENGRPNDKTLIQGKACIACYDRNHVAKECTEIGEQDRTSTKRGRQSPTEPRRDRDRSPRRGSETNYTRSKSTDDLDDGDADREEEPTYRTQQRRPNLNMPPTKMMGAEIPDAEEVDDMDIAQLCKLVEDYTLGDVDSLNEQKLKGLNPLKEWVRIQLRTRKVSYSETFYV